jgi:SAM-dependent methyltransferase
MFFPPNLAPEFMRLIKPIWESDHPDHVKLRVIWGMLTGCQGAVISQLLTSRIGNKVFAGPFRGMELTKDAMKWHYSPTLLGTYEWELHETVENLISRAPEKIVNIGCAFGYYSVGLALRLPETTIYAYDTDPTMREHCQAMAETNRVADRIIIGEEFKGEDFERFSSENAFFIIDIEGGEYELVDPVKYPALGKLDMILEIHDYLYKGLSTVMQERFNHTHNVKIIQNTAFNFPLQKILGSDYLPDHFDNLIATWESRGGPTPFGVITRK